MLNDSLLSYTGGEKLTVQWDSEKRKAKERSLFQKKPSDLGSECVTIIDMHYPADGLLIS